jgi:succinate dehydrogenase / fumarate reductase cytochrome b subunit
MIGPYYRPQLTSMLSIAHRATGVLLALGALLMAWWLVATAGGPQSHATFDAFVRTLPGCLLLAGLLFSLIYHWLNGLRHLFWDAGLGLDLRSAYASGWTVVALSLVGTAFVWFAARGWGGG